jgi:hypothetical protein
MLSIQFPKKANSKILRFWSIPFVFAQPQKCLWKRKENLKKNKCPVKECSQRPAQGPFVNTNYFWKKNFFFFWSLPCNSNVAGNNRGGEISIQCVNLKSYHLSSVMT